jgi:hypothetical protein
VNRESGTCSKFAVPKLHAVGQSIAEQHIITDGRVLPVGKKLICKPPKRVRARSSGRNFFKELASIGLPPSNAE